ncbi:MAG: hypothetical protein R2703_09690 [Micropruina glycogenica]
MIAAATNGPVSQMITISVPAEPLGENLVNSFCKQECPCGHRWQDRIRRMLGPATALAPVGAPTCLGERARYLIVRQLINELMKLDAIYRHAMV